MLSLIGWAALARADLIEPGSEHVGAPVATWVFAGLLLVNTIGNAVSKSPPERKIMTPTTLLLVICLVALIHLADKPVMLALVKRKMNAETRPSGEHWRGGR